MWILYAFGAATFAGLTAILSKIGVKNTDSIVATAVRTIVVLLFTWMMVFIVGSHNDINEVSNRTWIFLIFSGIAAGLSWLFFFKALQYGDVNKVTPIDKSSIILTMLLTFTILGESITLIKVCALIFIATGTFLMIQKKKEVKETKNQWIIYAILAAIFASLTTILGQIGIQDIESNLGTAIRTVVILVMAWLMVFITKKQNQVRNIDKKDLLFLIMSGIATGASWLLFFRALQLGPASVVIPIDRLSIVFTMAFSYFILKEKLTIKATSGLVIILVGTFLLLI